MNTIYNYLFMLVCGAPASEMHEIPFELLKTGHMVIEAKINEKGPYRFIFDTGAPASIVSSRVGKIAEINPASKVSISIFGNGGQVAIKSVQVGSSTSSNMQAILMDHPTIAVISKYFGQIDGILGYTFFSKYALRIDYKLKKIYLKETDYIPEDVIGKMVRSILKQKQEPRILVAAAYWGFNVSEGESKSSVLVKDLAPQSPASKAGLLNQDQLLEINGQWVTNLMDIQWIMATTEPNADCLVTVLRDGKKLLIRLSPSSGL